MAICTQCGSLLHNDDIISHKCLEADIPKKGKEKKKGKDMFTDVVK